MRRPDDHPDPGRLQGAHDGIGKLTGEPLLELRPPRDDLQRPGQLREPDHPPVRDVADVRDAMKRQEVMLTHRVKGDVADEHHLLMPYLEADAQDLLWIMEQARKDLGVHLSDAPRRVAQSFAFRILADRTNDLADGFAQGSVIKCTLWMLIALKRHVAPPLVPPRLRRTVGSRGLNPKRRNRRRRYHSRPVLLVPPGYETLSAVRQRGWRAEINDVVYWLHYL